MIIDLCFSSDDEKEKDTGPIDLCSPDASEDEAEPNSQDSAALAEPEALAEAHAPPADSVARRPRSRSARDAAPPPSWKVRERASSCCEMSSTDRESGETRPDERSAEKSCSDGAAVTSIMNDPMTASCCADDAPPAARWALVLDADWRTFFRESPKTFREVRWWYGLLASNRRVYLVHAVGYAVCFFVAWPSSLRNAFNGWGALVFVPYLVLLPSLCRLGGCAFEWRFTEQPGGGEAIDASTEVRKGTARVAPVIESEQEAPALEGLTTTVPGS